MKTFVTALALSATVLTAPAMALGIGADNLTRTLSFPEPVSEPVTKGQSEPGK